MTNRNLNTKSLPCVLAILFLICVAAPAQTGPTGTWRAEGVGDAYPWDLVLRADGTGSVVGAVSSCSSVRRAFEIFEATVEGSAIAFKCKSADGQRTVAFRGVIDGDGIAFTWDKQVQAGG